MKTITQQKPFATITQLLERHRKVYIIGCGTCATMCRTGGKVEVLRMKEQLEGEGKSVTGWMVIPTACDALTGQAMRLEADRLEEADAILVMTCAFGVQRVGSFTDKPVYPALDTLFIGMEESPGHFSEVCSQCGQCILGETAGICPITACAKGLLNGPCGGSNDGKCEVDPEKDCAWILIYERLKALGRLDLMLRYQPPRDFRKAQSPRKALIDLDWEEAMKCPR